MSPHEQLRKAALAAVKKHGGYKPAARAHGVNDTTVRELCAGTCRFARPRTYKAFGLPVPPDVDPIARIAAAVAGMIARGEEIQVEPIARAVGVSRDTARLYLHSHGLKTARATRKEAGEEKSQRRPPCPTAILFAAHREKLAAIAEMRSRRSRQEPRADRMPRVYRYTGEMLS